VIEANLNPEQSRSSQAPLRRLRRLSSRDASSGECARSSREVLVGVRQDRIDQMNNTVLRDDVGLDDVRDEVASVVNHSSERATLAERDLLTGSRRIVLLVRTTEQDGPVHDVVEDGSTERIAAQVGRDVLEVHGIDPCLVDGSEEGDTLARNKGIDEVGGYGFHECGEVGRPLVGWVGQCVQWARGQINDSRNHVNQDVLVSDSLEDD